MWGYYPDNLPIWVRLSKDFFPSICPEIGPPFSLLVCLEKERRVVNGVTILPWKEFVAALWAGDLC
jgi:hypothetical protein